VDTAASTLEEDKASVETVGTLGAGGAGERENDEEEGVASRAPADGDAITARLVCEIARGNSEGAETTG